MRYALCCSLICDNLRKSAVNSQFLICVSLRVSAVNARILICENLRLIADVWLVFEVPYDCFPTKLHDLQVNGTAFGAYSYGSRHRVLRGDSAQGEPVVMPFAYFTEVGFFLCLYHGSSRFTRI